MTTYVTLPAAAARLSVNPSTLHTAVLIGVIPAITGPTDGVLYVADPHVRMLQDALERQRSGGEQ